MSFKHNDYGILRFESHIEVEHADKSTDAVLFAESAKNTLNASNGQVQHR
jgi:hypothetical protein